MRGIAGTRIRQCAETAVQTRNGSLSFSKTATPKNPSQPSMQPKNSICDSPALQREINPWRDKAFAERYVEALGGFAGVPE